MQCGLVVPYWIHIGWVHWAGTSQRERLMMIEYRRCDGRVVSLTKKDGLTFPWCPAHAAEMGGEEGR